MALKPEIEDDGADGETQCRVMGKRKAMATWDGFDSQTVTVMMVRTMFAA